MGCLLACGSDRAPHPDVLLVVIDTLRADRTTVLRPDLVTTERLAAFGARGIVYEQAVSPSSWTLPAMAGLFSGRQVTTSRTRVFKDAPTLAERFGEAGYRTVGIVANPLLTADNGFDRGFEAYDVAPARDRELLKQDLSALRSWNAEAVVDRALAHLAEPADDRPLFVYVHLMDPHAPYDPDHARYAPESPGWSAPLPDGTPPRVSWTPRLDAAQQRLLQTFRRSYDGQVLYTDRMLGRLVDAWGTGSRGEALIAVTSDHGEGLFSHARNADRDQDDGPLGGAYDEHGEQLFEEALRVPLWLAGPGVPSGRRETRAVSTADLGTTLLTLAGRSLSGSRLPLSASDPSPAVIAGTGNRGWFARTATRKLIEPFPYRSERPDVAPRLFAVEAGGFADETEDLGASEPDTLSELRALLDVWRGTEDQGDDGAAPVDEATLERLRRLGYVR